MSSVYRPWKNVDNFAEDFRAKTSEFSRDFSLLADLIEKSEPDSEAFALYLSTCRNVYLTINGMFFDVREALGKISPDLGIFGALQQARAGSFEAMEQSLASANEALAAFEAKRSCWERREDLYKKFESFLAQFKNRDQRAIRATLLEVIEHDEDCEIANFSTFFSFETNEGDEQRVLLQKLTETARSLKSVTECVKRIKNTAEKAKEALLFSRARIGANESNDFFEESPLIKLGLELKQRATGLHDYLTSRSQPTMAIVSNAIEASEESALTTALTTDFQQPIRPESLIEENDPEKILEFLTRLSTHLQDSLGKTYSELGQLFRPNIGKAPLPSPFLVDLSVSPPPKADADESVKASPVPLSKTALETVVVAVAQPPFPSSEISNTTCRYKEPMMRIAAKDWACAAIQAAASKAKLIVFPELFIPEDSIGLIRDVAQAAGIGVVCGIEGTWTGHLYSCQASIILPDNYQDRRQYKNRPSNYESENFYTKGGQQCFLRSTIGSFSVVLCSDLREFDVVSAIEQQPFLDYMIVCSCNPFPELWKHIAIADAAKLNCYVIICNWENNKNAYGFGNGSFCAAPIRSVETSSNPEPAFTPQDIIVPNGKDALAGSILFYELNLAGLYRDRNKPHSGFLAPPRRRLHINK